MKFARMFVFASSITLFSLYRRSIYGFVGFHPNGLLDIVILFCVGALMAYLLYLFEKRRRDSNPENSRELDGHGLR